MASGIYSIFKENLMNKEVDLEADTIKAILLTSAHSFVATHVNLTAIDANEIAATGNYTVGGETLANLSVTGGITTMWNADDVAWTTATFNASYCVLHDTTAANSGLIACIDFGGIKAVSAGTFTIQWNAAGIMTLNT